MIDLDGISVVIPNYNGELLLPQILPPALAALQKTGLPFEVIVADDASTDASVTLLKQQFSAIKVIVAEKNKGFSVTANSGIYAAKFSWVLLLNSDVKLEQDYFLPLIKYTNQEKIFGVMGRIIGWQDEKIQDGAKFPLFHGAKIKTSENYILANADRMKEGLYTMYLSGANAFFNKKKFVACGGFNEMFSPYYAEDAELSIRAWRLGFTCLYEHNAVCRHKVSSTIKGASRQKQINIIYNRNKMYLHAIHLELPKIIFWFFQTAIEAVLRIFLLQFGYIQSFFHFLKNSKKVYSSRKKIKHLATQKLLSLQEVTNKIYKAVEGEELIRFKS